MRLGSGRNGTGHRNGATAGSRVTVLGLPNAGSVAGPELVEIVPPAPFWKAALSVPLLSLDGVPEIVNPPVWDMHVRYCVEPKQLVWKAGPPLRSRQVRTLPLPKHVVWPLASIDHSSAAAPAAAIRLIHIATRHAFRIDRFHIASCVDAPEFVGSE